MCGAGRAGAKEQEAETDEVARAAGAWPRPS